MMRVGRASAVLALLLLTSAATASAECAWVLWSTVRMTLTLGAGDRIQVATGRPDEPPDKLSGRLRCTRRGFVRLDTP